MNKVEQLQDSAANLAGHHNQKQRIHYVQSLKDDLAEAVEVANSTKSYDKLDKLFSAYGPGRLNRIPLNRCRKIVSNRKQLALACQSVVRSREMDLLEVGLVGTVGKDCTEPDIKHDLKHSDNAVKTVDGTDQCDLTDFIYQMERLNVKQPDKGVVDDTQDTS